MSHLLSRENRKSLSLWSYKTWNGSLFYPCVARYCFKPYTWSVIRVEAKDLRKVSPCFIKTTAPLLQITFLIVSTCVSMTYVVWAWISGWTQSSVIWIITPEKLVHCVTREHPPGIWEWPDQVSKLKTRKGLSQFGLEFPSELASY